MTTFHSAQVNQELMDGLFDYIDRYQVDVSEARFFLGRSARSICLY